MATNNSINLTDSGIVSYDGAGTFAGRTLAGTTDFIDVTNGDGVSGAPTFSIGANFEQTGMHLCNGIFVDKTTIGVTSDGATITLSVEKSGGGDSIVVFSDGYYDWDTTPAATVTLTAGTDTSPVENYVYFLQSSKTLVANTTGFPTSAEHARIATVLCQSAASIQTDGPYKVHQWTDDVNENDEQGHITDLSFWIRKQNATWIDGVAQTFNITTNAGSADNVILTTTAGNILQLHINDFPAFTGTPDIYVVNDSSTPYTKITDLNAALTDSTGASMAGRYFTLVIWGCVSQDAADCKLFLNLPSGSYSNQSDLIADSSRYANYSIPAGFTGTGFLIAAWDLRHQSAGNGTWTSIQEIDLRGQIPARGAGTSNAFPNEFVDNVFRVIDDGDQTKKIAFQASGITTSTTRTITMADQDINLTPTTGSFQASDADLTALSALSSTGFVARTGVATYAERTLVEGTGIDITNSSGSAGNPTISFDITEIPAIPISIVTDSGTAIPSTNSFSIVGGEGIDTSAAGSVLTILGENATTTNKGVASFLTDDFTVSSGAVSLGDSVTKSIVTDSGTATAVSHSFTISGGTNVTTSASGSTITINSSGGGGAGSWSNVSETTISNDATVEFIGLNQSGASYLFVFEDWVPAVDGTQIFAEFSTDNGSTWNSTSGSYAWTLARANVASLSGYEGSSSDVHAEILWTEAGTGTNESISGEFLMINPQKTAYTKCEFVLGGLDDAAAIYHNYGFCIFKTTSAIDGVRFFSSSGNASSGTIRLLKRSGT